MRWSRTAPLLALCAVSAAAGAVEAQGPAEVARLTFVEKMVEQTGTKGWQVAREGTGLRTGAQIRTAADAVARVEFPWMTATLGPGALVSFPDDFVLSSVLEQGRVRLRSDQREILKLVTAEAEVRGRGQVVVRRQGGTTLVSVIDGRFLVEAGGRTVTLLPGKGTIARKGVAPLPPQDLPAPPEVVSPAQDPVYVAPSQFLALDWKPTSPPYSIELLPVGSDQILIQRDAVGPPYQVEIPWPGAFRWRVASRDSRGLEGVPSGEGLIVVDDK